jgi:hypothetical protein
MPNYSYLELRTIGNITDIHYLIACKEGAQILNIYIYIYLNIEIDIAIKTGANGVDTSSFSLS